uniref:tyrosine-type recombinase/integrase n=1 Tax=Agathobacter sp. TaxID=2021311 RepID=UPI004055D5E2
MAKKGENIRKRSDGRWEGRYQDEGTRYHSIYAKSYAEVKTKLLEARKHSQTEAEDVTEQEVMIGEVAECWLNQVKQEKKTATYVKYESVYRIYIKDILGYEKISYLSSASVSTLFPETCSESTLKSIYCVINQILSYSHLYYQTAEIALKRKNIQRKNAVIRIFNNSEQGRLVRYLYRNMDVCKLGILLCLSMGLRLGEICALRWEDIDFDMRILHIKRTVQRISFEEEKKSLLIENEPKTASSKREIPISNRLYELLKEFKCTDLYLLNGKEPMEPRTYQYKFKRYLRAAGIEDANFHVLRHTFATNCIGNGADVKSVSELLGHSDVKITLNRYVHPTLATKRSNMNILDSVYGEYLGHISS